MLAPRKIRQLVGPIALAVGLGACAGRARDESARPRPISADDEKRPPRDWESFGALDSMKVVGETRSAHPSGDFIASIRVNDVAARYGTKGRDALPEGSLVVEVLATESNTPPVVYYAMLRKAPGYFPEGGDWAYAVVTPDGKVEAEGKLKLCARCHAEAPREHVFEVFRGPAVTTP
jgi:hypothetical protein